MATIGNKITIEGVNYYRFDYYSNGGDYGTVFKDDDAFYNHPEEICYIPEHGIPYDYDPIEIEGELYYPENKIAGYTRLQLEHMLEDYVDDEGNKINVEDFYQNLVWECPETRLTESYDYIY